MVSGSPEWAPARHNSGTNGTIRAQPQPIKRHTFRDRIYAKHPTFADQLRLNRDIEEHLFGANYADRHLNSLHRRFHVAGINLSTANATELQQRAERLARRGEQYLNSGIAKLPSFFKKYPIAAPANRNNLASTTWWRKKLYAYRAEVFADTYRALGIVHKKQTAYLDRHSLENYQRKQLQYRQYLEAQVIENQRGEQFTLASLADTSLSNPKIRRAEMMTHLRGIEEWAAENGRCAMFVTLTTPSRMHRMHASGMRNVAFDGSAVRHAQMHLQQRWSRTRAKLDRDKLSIHGIRVVEPHHDGCPHWHLLVYCPREQANQVEAAIKHYALQDCGTEPGAAEHRVKVEHCDPAKGSPTGYIAKYISKNLDGYGLEESDDGAPINDYVESTVAWARTYRIRQFQFFGIPNRGIWRALYKIKETIANPHLESLRGAVHAKSFHQFISLYNNLPREILCQPIRIQRESANIDLSTGELLVGIDEKLTRSWLLFAGEYFSLQSQIWFKPAPADSSAQVPSTLPSVATASRGHLGRDQVALLGLVSITVRTDVTAKNDNTLKPPISEPPT